MADMSFSAVQTAMAEAGYMASDDLAVALHLAISLQRPILLEGAAGVGKTEVARVLATVQKTQLIRLQCYEGLEAAHAIY
jgi:MoxR-like ATPase